MYSNLTGRSGELMLGRPAQISLIRKLQHLGDWQTTSAGGDDDEMKMFPLTGDFLAGALKLKLLLFCRVDWRESRVDRYNLYLMCNDVTLLVFNYI